MHESYPCRDGGRASELPHPYTFFKVPFQFNSEIIVQNHTLN